MTPFYVFYPNYLILLELNPFFVLFNLFIYKQILSFHRTHHQSKNSSPPPEEGSAAAGSADSSQSYDTALTGIGN
mgnify:CR=1 FL=1